MKYVSLDFPCLAERSVMLRPVRYRTMAELRMSLVYGALLRP